ncbi:MAG: RNA methyltransferase [Ilumatobacteraceae bacterium]
MTAFIPVDDPDDERLAVFRLNERQLSPRPQRRNDDGEGLFMAEGDLVVERSLEAGCVPVVSLVDELRPPPVADVLATIVPVYAGGERVRAMVTKLGVPNSVVAIFRRPPRCSVAQVAERANRLVLVEAVDNPANIGAIVRNATGLGWDGLIVDGTSADPLARRSLRVSMGHAVVLPHARTTDVAATLRDLVAAGFVIAALTPDPSATDIGDVVVPDRLVVCMGAERVGLSEPVMAAATVCIRIPMHAGVDSLNVAAATAIACHALRKP